MPHRSGHADLFEGSPLRRPRSLRRRSGGGAADASSWTGCAGSWTSWSRRASTTWSSSTSHPRARRTARSPTIRRSSPRSGGRCGGALCDDAGERGARCGSTTRSGSPAPTCRASSSPAAGVRRASLERVVNDDGAGASWCARPPGGRSPRALAALRRGRRRPVTGRPGPVPLDGRRPRAGRAQPAGTG